MTKINLSVWKGKVLLKSPEKLHNYTAVFIENLKNCCYPKMFIICASHAKLVHKNRWKMYCTTHTIFAIKEAKQTAELGIRIGRKFHFLAQSTLFENYSKCRIWIFQFCHFSVFGNTVLTASFRFSKTRQNGPFLAFLMNFCSLKM